MKKVWLMAALASFISANAQERFNPDTVKAGLFDNGKMWTFDFPPTEYFEKTYQFKPDDEWFRQVRMSALRFANWCSASFVSADGLVMTNHHCSRDVATGVQRPGEDFNNQGFYAATFEDERRIPDLFVDQLVMIEDITTRVQRAFSKGKTDEEKLAARTAEFDAIKKEYADKEGWKGLTLQPITLYQGARYSLYGFKRYNDVRLVIIPELALGFFGGDYDNFTYPRYCLDFTLFRVYDDNGKPMKTPHYFKFNTNGVKENEPVFVVGNPGSTNRQATVAILEYFRDYAWPAAVERLSTRSQILQRYLTTHRNDSLLNEVFGFENTIKAYSGMLQGLRDPYIMARRKAFEVEFQKAVAKNAESTKPESKSKSPLSVWSEIAETQKEINKIYFKSALLSPAINSTPYSLAMQMVQWAGQQNGEAEKSKQKIVAHYPTINELEQSILAAHYGEVAKRFGVGDSYVQAALQGRSAEEAARAAMTQSKILDVKFREQLLQQGPKAVLNSKDPLLVLAQSAGKRYDAAQSKLKQLNARMSGLRARLSLMLFDVYGTRIPPDATFSLRFADGVVKSYEYNGTKAPIYTTFYGLYDRFYSFQQKDPWHLPQRWQNPPPELLKEPMNFISTNDIIGGNSGSPMINRNREVVGLIFDGNMESLPGNYLFLPESNRTVSVHAGGILAGLKYIYKAQRLVDELSR
jgi:hypothetical protein